jgi:peptide/nickel transport system substrate-binding protein
LVIRNHNAAVLFGSPEKAGKLRTGAFEIALFGWGQPPDPSAMEVVYGSKYLPPDGQNMGRFRNSELDSLAALGTRIAAQDLRVPIYRRIESILLRELPVIPLVWLVEADPMTVRLHNFRPNPTSSAGDTWNVHTWWLSAAASQS